VKDLRSIGMARRPEFRTLLAIVAAALAVLLVLVARCRGAQLRAGHRPVGQRQNDHAGLISR